MKLITWGKLLQILMFSPLLLTSCTGTIPTEIGALTSLTSMHLQGAQISGKNLKSRGINFNMLVVNGCD